ncbi:sperm flagellar protein 1-like [Leguminivora glycinivorella]|uniref:sperm flagellar protein 1-like n=1 Tax=Leguminivora glycinivorella TaxID=1035111 RepID=UPI002010AE09|nr:sperm flagellar protein 1-like [Leguminivora glycinivorella]
MSAFDSPIPLADIEAVLAWVDNFKLSRPTKKINRDFSDAVLLAEILNVYYPKLVEMHNYPPRNSHALKLNNWMTLNRKVLRKLKLNLCCSTMEQLANCAPGVIERVLIMVKEKIRRDEELTKSKEGLEPLDSGGSYYECGDDEHVLVVPVKSRVNGILETIQQKVVSHETFLALKQELKDLQDCNEVLKNKQRSEELMDEFKDSVEDAVMTIEDSIKKEVKEITNTLQFANETYYLK